MSVDKIIQKLEMVKEFDVKESFLDDYITSVEKYLEDLKKIKQQNLPPIETIKLVEKSKMKSITDCCFDYKVIYEMLKSNGKDITLTEVKKYLLMKIK